MFVDPELKDFFAENDLFETVFAIEGEIFRNVKNRKTMRFAFNGKNYFVKIHRGVGWKEIIKCLSMGKKPVLGAENEFALTFGVCCVEFEYSVACCTASCKKVKNDTIIRRSNLHDSVN